MSKIAVVTGASAGIGAATAVALVDVGYQVVLGARRLDRLQEVADACGGRALTLDVTSADSVAQFCEGIDEVSLLVNNAGGALGTDTIADADESRWQQMWERNVLGTVRMTRSLLPKLIASGAGHVVNVGSVAAHSVYEGGGGYTSAKHAERALTATLRLELLGQPVRVTEIDPGLVNTEFSVVRFDGDQARADAVYDGMTPLTAEDVADCIVWSVTRPAHVNIDMMVVKPLDQAGVGKVHRR